MVPMSVTREWFGTVPMPSAIDPDAPTQWEMSIAADLISMI